MARDEHLFGSKERADQSVGPAPVKTLSHMLQRESGSVQKGNGHQWNQASVRGSLGLISRIGRRVQDH